MYILLILLYLCCEYHKQKLNEIKKKLLIFNISTIHSFWFYFILFLFLLIQNTQTHTNIYKLLMMDLMKTKKKPRKLKSFALVNIHFNHVPAVAIVSISTDLLLKKRKAYIEIHVVLWSEPIWRQSQPHIKWHSTLF